MPDESPRAELIRLHDEQSEALQKEVFCPLTNTEKSEYDKRATRIRQLMSQLQDSSSLV
jgi:hypothetical protein